MRYFWRNLDRCVGITKRGTRCMNYVRRPYERRPGDWVFPQTCYLHRDQEPPNKSLELSDWNTTIENGQSVEEP